MAKILKASFEKNCIGCELCVLEIQRQLGKVGLEGSLIRIFKDKSEKGSLTFKVDLDLSVNELDIDKVHKICPALVFTIEEGVGGEHELVK